MRTGFLTLGMLVLAAAAQGGAPPGAPTDPPPVPVLHIYFANLAPVPKATIKEAEREMVAIYADAGVQVEWHNIGPEYEGEPVQRPFVRVILGWTRSFRKLVPHGGVLGAGWREAEGLPLASTVVLAYERLMETARVGHHSEFPAMAAMPNFYLVVARVAAHEVAHAVLNRSAHSPRGLMRSQFSGSDLVSVHREPFLFCSDDGEQLADALMALQTMEGVIVADGNRGKSPVGVQPASEHAPAAIAPAGAGLAATGPAAPQGPTTAPAPAPTQ